MLLLLLLLSVLDTPDRDGMGTVEMEDEEAACWDLLLFLEFTTVAEEEDEVGM